MLELLMVGNSNIHSSNYWEQLADGPSARCCHVMVGIGNKLYLHGGAITASGAANGQLWEYDISSKIWTRKADGPALCRHAIWIWNGRLYVHSGATSISSGLTSALWYYQPETDTWTQLSPGSGLALLDRRAAVVGDSVYLFSGHTGSSAVSSMQIYYPLTNTWANMSGGIASHGNVLAALDNKLYCYRGRRGTTIVSELGIYDIASATWIGEYGYNLPQPRYMATGAIINRKLYIHGGMPVAAVTGTRFDDLWQCNIDTRIWTKKLQR